MLGVGVGTFLSSLRLPFDLPQPLDQLVLLSLYPLLLPLRMLALLLLVLQLRSAETTQKSHQTVTYLLII